MDKLLIRPWSSEIAFGKPSEFSYNSPIELIIGQMSMEQEKRMEREVMKALQDVGVTVNKDELVKALKYDRGQYEKGFADGCRMDIDQLCQEVKADTVRKIIQRIKEDAKAIFLLSDPPKIMLEIREDALDQIAKEMLEGKDGT